MNKRIKNKHKKRLTRKQARFEILVYIMTDTLQNGNYAGYFDKPYGKNRYVNVAKALYTNAESKGILYWAGLGFALWERLYREKAHY